MPLHSHFLHNIGKRSRRFPQIVHSSGLRKWSKARRNFCRVTTFDPSPDASRQVPTPLVFVKSSLFDHDEDVTSRMYSKLVNDFTKNGYSCLDIQHSPNEISDTDSLEFVLEGAAEELNTAIKSSSIPFPPVLVSHSLSALVTQIYVSSFPATALILVSPPPNVSEALSIIRTQETSPFKELFRLDMKEFNFEPWFPIAVFVGKGNGMKETMERECRLVREGADLVEVEGLAQGLSGEGNVNLTDLREKMHTWMDEVGV